MVTLRCSWVPLGCQTAVGKGAASSDVTRQRRSSFRRWIALTKCILVLWLSADVRPPVRWCFPTSSYVAERFQKGAAADRKVAEPNPDRSQNCIANCYDSGARLADVEASRFHAT